MPIRFFIRHLFVALVAPLLCIAGAAAEDKPHEFSLANSYRTDDTTIHLADYWMSEKYDGVRALWDGKRLRSRGGLVFAAPGWFIANLPTVTLDGELWLARNRFEETVSTVRRQTAHDGWRSIRYMVFDLPKHGGAFRQRHATLLSLAANSDNPYWRVVEQLPIGDRTDLQRYFDGIVDDGGEGVMLRRIESRHRGGRNDDLLKYKPFADAEAVVVGHHPGKGKYHGMLGSLRVQTPTGIIFNVGSGLSDDQRRNPPPIGATITYQYQGLTKHGKPRFPVFLRIRGDADY